MKRSHSLIIRISIIAGLAVMILGYGLFQARNFIKGPVILVSSPQTGNNATTSLIRVEGLSANIAQISLDDRPIFVDKLGKFSEKLLLSPGYNIIKLRAQDRFGRTTVKLVELNYAPDQKIGATSTNIIQ